MSVKGKVIDIWAPSAFGFLKAMNPFIGAVWSLKFKCGACEVTSTVQHDEEKKHHKCPVCGAINLLKETNYYDIHG
jgi:DNA-directed RNA polymerase subunit RPC12/RpoP